MRLACVFACGLATVALGKSDRLLSSQHGLLRSSNDAVSHEVKPDHDYNDETHLHEVHPEIWKHEMPLTLEWIFAVLWVCMIASVPLLIPILDKKQVTNTQKTLACCMWASLFGGIYLFTHIIKFQSAHFATVRCLTMVECIYLMAQVITTVGYGDITPAYPRGQVFVGMFVLLSFLVIAMLVSDVAQHLIDKAEEYERRLAAEAERDLMRNSRGAPSKPKLKTPSTVPVIRALVVFAFCAVVGICFFHWYPGEGKDWFQATYMSIITLSTVGFGAFTPSTEAGKVFGAFWMVIGCSALVSVITAFTELMNQFNEFERYDHNAAMEKFMIYKEQLQAQQVLGDRVDKMTFMKLALVHKGLARPEDFDALSAFFKELGPEGDNCVDMAYAESRMAQPHPAMAPVERQRKKKGGRKFDRQNK